MYVRKYHMTESGSIGLQLIQNLYITIGWYTVTSLDNIMK